VKNVEGHSGDKVIFHNGSTYHPWRNIREIPEYQDLCVKNTRLLFGDNIVVYIDAQKKIKSIAGTGSKPDGILLSVSDAGDLKLSLIEYEVEDHELRKHVIPQLIDFVEALENQETKDSLWETIADNIEKDSKATEKLKTVIGDKNILRFLKPLMSHKPNIIIIIDKLPSEKALTEVIRRIRYEVGISPIVKEFTPFKNDKGDIIFLSDSEGSKSRTVVSPSPKLLKPRTSVADLPTKVRDIIKYYDYKVFDIAQVNDAAAKALPELFSALGARIFYHRVRAVIFALKAKEYLRKLDERGHSGKYQQVKAF
jgi:hypothetical protein